ncbi:LOW QUALITY PROTEIN: beta-defensin 118-like [Trichechus manatus latirostris]|uniref:LOW QUALITY PROTEIN: beta-defensin 118-like n=1 Tax=Trichechus manatus latirostris TaxID=127582 RepID=A0A2Y9G4A7_TRIMA|nr:LOW QUALITY PROTEIN: beta-defensin 118-like [Trichechus manatus latirostris]
MRRLFLALAALMLLPLVIPDYRGRKKCLNKGGRCKKRCNYGEMKAGNCKHRAVCCVPSKQDSRPQNPVLQTTPTSTPYFKATKIVVVDKTITPHSIYFEVNAKTEMMMTSDLELGTRSSLPQVHQTT